MQKVKKGHKYFETQKEDENVLLVARKHWIVYTPAFFVSLMVYILGLVFFLNIGNLGIISSSEPLRAISIVSASLFLLFITLFAYMSWLINYLNVQIVTDEHVVDVDQLGIFNRKISELTLDDIQDISATKSGIFQSFLSYGDICIQTAGEKPNFNFEKVPDPHELSRKLMEVRDEYCDKKN